MVSSLWAQCLDRLAHDLPEQQLNTWLRPLHAEEGGGRLRLLAPNRFVLDRVKTHYLDRIEELATYLVAPASIEIVLEIGSQTRVDPSVSHVDTADPLDPPGGRGEQGATRRLGPKVDSRLNNNFTFTTFVQGNSNRLAKAAALQVAANPGSTYNPLFIYGDVGLGKTHLMHAVGNQMRETDPNARVVYMHSEKFVDDMVRALQHGAINDFKRYYRNLDGLLIDDIQFLAGKDRSQEEFFYTFNALLEGQSQVILTSDRYPKEVEGLEERLKSRFGSGLTVPIEPPELETRVAILRSKSEQANVQLPNEVAFFVAKRIRANIRELEGALRRIIATATLTGKPITLEFVKETLKDLISVADKMITLDNIQRTVSEYYKIRHADLISTRRARAIARPRQIAMALAKELTEHSLPEIGRAFGGRDHTTVIHACRRIADLRKSDSQVEEDYNNLVRTLSR